MNKSSVALIVVLALAAVSIPLWQNDRIEKLRVENAQLSKVAAEIEPLRQKVKTLSAEQVDQQELKRLRSAQSEALQLRAKLSEKPAPAPANALAGSAAGGNPAQDGARANPLAGMDPAIMRDMVEQQLVNRLDRMKSKLNLTDEQYASFKVMLHDQAEQGAKMASKMMSGKSSGEDMTDVTTSAANAEQQIRALLTPEQTTAYDEFQKDEIKGQARMAATGEMMMLQGIANLTPEQTTQASEILTEQNLKNMEWAKANPGEAGNDMVKMLRDQMEAKAKALEGILEPAQLENFRKTQESQMKMIEAFLPGKQTPANPAPPAEAILKPLK